MDQIHKEALRRTRLALVKDLDVNNIFDELLSQEIFTYLMMEYIMAERKSSDKVRRLLDDLVKGGPDVYLKFLDVLRKTGYEFLADLIVENEGILRRKKEPFLSEQFQASNQTQEEIHPTPIPWSRTNIATLSSFVGSQNSNLDSSSLESFGSSSMIYSGSYGSSIPISRSGPYSLIPQRKESAAVLVESMKGATLDKSLSFQLDPPRMDVDENDSNIISVKREVLVRETPCVPPSDDGNRPFILQNIKEYFLSGTMNAEEREEKEEKEVREDEEVLESAAVLVESMKGATLDKSLSFQLDPPRMDVDENDSNIISVKREVLVRETPCVPPSDDGNRPFILQNIKEYFLSGTMNAEEREEKEKKEVREDEEVLVLSDANFLPRYKYHRFLLDWFVEGLPQHLASKLKSNFQDCSIIIGGRLSDNDKEKLFGDATTIIKGPFINQPTGPDTRMGIGFQEVLIVYFFTEDTSDLFQLIAMMNHYFWPGNISLLFVIAMDNMNEERIKSTYHRYLQSNSIDIVDFASKSKEEIITKITCSLEKRLITFFEQAHKTLQKYSSPTENVRNNLLEVKAILRRLGKAANVSIPEPFKNDVFEDDTERKEIEKLLQRFADQILYRRYDGNTLYIIVCSETVKNNIIYHFSELHIKNISCVITVSNRLSTTELSKPGVPLHGAKFVYANEDVAAFYIDNAFATTGCLMMANNNNTMVAVTCRHAVKDVETCYTLIENSVITLGQKQQSGNEMKFLHDDIAVIVVDNETQFVVNQKCEKLLLDTSDIPSPAQIYLSSLETGDIVHKRGAKTGLTTGVVNGVKFEKIGNFIFPSWVIYVIGRDGKPFADKGDSGCLVFRHSMSPVSNVLDVCAMVIRKIDIPIQNPDILCFPFNEGCESLQKNVPDIQNLTFFNV